MKSNYFSFVIALVAILFSFTSCVAQNKEKTDTKNNNQQWETVLKNYFNLKDALVQTDSNLAAENAQNLLVSFKQVDSSALNDKDRKVWATLSTNLIEDAEHITETKDVGHQRDHFMTLSDNIYKLVKENNIHVSSYYQFCPMANNGKGAYWLSEEETIKNPYFGDKMLHCGRIEETIK